MQKPEVVNIAKVLVRSDQGDYLVLRSSEWPENPIRSMQPDIPGGVVEEGEDHLAGAIRELSEETSINLGAKDFELIWRRSEDFDQTTYFRSIYEVSIPLNTDIKLSMEHDMFWWASPGDFMNLKWRQPYKRIFKYLHQIGVIETS